MNFSDMQKVFDIFNNTKAVIVELGDYDDYENTYTETEVGTVTGDMQPYSGGKASEEYGLSVECQYQFFCPYNEAVKVGAYLVLNGRKFEIMHTAIWELGMTVLLKEVDIYG